MFLRKIPYESVQRRRIRDWLLLMLRLAALAVIVLAFARPFLRSQALAAARRRRARGGRAARSLLQHGLCGDVGPRAAGGGAGDRRHDALGPRVGRAVRRHTGSRGAIDAGSIARDCRDQRRHARAWSDQVRPRAEAGRQHARRVAAAASRGDSSCRTSSGRAGRPTRRLRLPGGATLTPVAVDGGDGVNLALTPVSIQRVPFEGQERVAITAGVLNRGDDAVNDLAGPVGDGRPRRADDEGQRGAARVGVDDVHADCGHRAEHACLGAAGRGRDVDPGRAVARQHLLLRAVSGGAACR